MLERARDPQEAQSADEDLPHLQSPVCLAEEMGQGLGAGSVLLRSVQETAGDTTMMRPVVLPLLSMVFALPAFAEDTPTFDPLGPGDHTRTVLMGEQKRTYLVHVPKEYDPKKPAPVILALHGAAMDGSMMVWFSGLNKKSDEAGFIVVYGSVRDRQGDWLIRSSNCGFANRR